MPPVIDKSKCIHCSKCADICPLSVFTYKKGEFPVIAYPDECWHCNSCVLDCPKGAVTLDVPLNYMLLRVEAKQLKPSER